MLLNLITLTGNYLREIMRIIYLAIILLIFFSAANKAQENRTSQDSIDVTVLDSYVTPEVPHTFMLTFFTSKKCKSKVVIDKKYTYTVSDKLTTSHNIKIDISNLNFKTKSVPFIIVVRDSLGNISRSDINEFDIPGEIKVKGESNFLLFCLFGAMVFALPNPAYVSQNGKGYFSLTKEIPLISIRSSNFNYPFGYFSGEYSHIFNAPYKNFLRIGYKQLIVVHGIEYFSPGIDWFTNFKGFNGISLEFAIGWFKILNTFTVYTRYRYNIEPGNSVNDFHEISIGLYSSFFSVYF